MQQRIVIFIGVALGGMALATGNSPAQINTGSDGSDIIRGAGLLAQVNRQS
jgi:hypothetical protein